MLKSAFVWLDAHPGAYWVPAGLASVALLLRLLVVIRAGSGAGAPPGRWRGLDPLLLGLFLFAWRWPFFLHGEEYSPDESQLISGAITLNHDPVFWRSVDGTTSGPLNFYALLPIHWFGAPIDYFTARVAALLMVWGALWASLSLLRRHAGPALAWLILLPTAMLFATTTAGDLVHYSSEHLSIFLFAVAAALLAGPDTPRGWRLALGAICAGAMPWAKLQAGPLGATLLGWTAWRVWADARATGQSWTALGRLAVAAISPTLLVVTATAATGVLAAAWQHYFVINVLYVGKPDPIAQAAQFMLRLAMLDGRMPLFVCTAIALSVGAAIGLAARRVRPGAFAAAGILVALAAVFVMAAPRRGYLHYTLLLPIPFTLLVGSLVTPWWQSLTGRWARRATLLVLIAAGLLPLVTRLRQPVPFMFGQFAHDWRHPRSPEAEVIRGVTPPGAALAVWGWAPSLHVETGLRQASPDPNTVWLLVPHPRIEDYRRQYVDDIIRAAPAVFVDATGPGAFALIDRSTAGHELLADLAYYIHQHYTQVADLGRSRIYLRNGTDGRPPATGTQITAWLARGRRAPVNPSSSIDGPTTANLSDLPRHDVRGRQVAMIHPPCRLEWDLPTNARAVELDFGFDPRAVAEGLSNGAEVLLELEDTGVRRLLHRQYLNPHQRPMDAEPFKLTIPLPPVTPTTKLVLRTDPGPHGNGAWDWVYLGSLSFRQSDAFTPEQFPGFNRMPDAVHAPHSNLIVHEGAQVFQAYPPVTVMFRLRGDERNLRLAFGLHPSAYSGPGRSDGVTFRVELRRAGQPTRPVWHRLLEPVDRPGDRGTQEAAIPLRDLRPGDELILRIDTGPDINNAWDSTYVRRLVLD